MEHPRILLLGASGMLGRAFVARAEADGIEMVPRSRPDFDLQTLESVNGLGIEHHPLVINCAAWTDVDGAEMHEPEATRANGAFVGELARRCRRHGSTLVHFSTDYVFDGGAEKPYPADEPRKPLNAYGRGKAVGEAELEASGARYLLIRTSWLYAPWGKNFVRTMIDLGKTRELVRVVDDQRGRPTSAEQLCDATLRLVASDALGTYHVTDGGDCSWYEFARAIFAMAQCSARLEPCTSADFPRPARRPAYSVLDLSKTEARIGLLPPWEQSVKSVVSRL